MKTNSKCHHHLCLEIEGAGTHSHRIDFVIMGKVVWSYEVKASWYLLAEV